MWVEAALDAVKYVAETAREFTSDDLWDHITQPREPRALGAVMRNAQKLGYIKATDRWTPSERVECHGRPVRVWASLLIGGPVASGAMFCEHANEVPQRCPCRADCYCRVEGSCRRGRGGV
jgi:hypothetical protein